MINDHHELEDDERGMLHVPWLGSFVAFSIDPGATLRYYCHGGDAVAQRLAQNLACKQYAAYCVQVRRDTIQRSRQLTDIKAVESRTT